MPLPTPTPAVSRDDAQLEASLGSVEAHLAALGQALKQQDAAATESAASALHQALARAVDGFRGAARRGHVSPALRRRLALTSGQVAAQREAVARASTALDRAIDVLLPDVAAARHASVYAAPGSAARLSSGGLAQA